MLNRENRREILWLRNILMLLAVAVSFIFAGCRSERLLVDAPTGDDSPIPPDTFI